MRDHGEVVARSGGDVGEVHEVVAQVHRADLGIEDLAHRCDHVLAAERRAVVPADAPAEVEDEGELIGRDAPVGRQRRLERVVGMLARVELGHRLEHLALEDPVDGEGRVGELVEAGRLLIEADHQRASAARRALVHTLGQPPFLPGGIR